MAEHIHDDEEYLQIEAEEEDSYGEEPEDVDEELLGAEGYQFEPMAVPRAANLPETVDVPVPEPARERRVGNTDWCRCNNCSAMPTERESLCCGEVKQVIEMLDKERIDCITNHPGFDAICLNPHVLDVAYLAYAQDYTAINDMTTRRRYIGYRQFVRWVWKKLGKKVTVVVPACVVASIREKYRDPHDTYTGHLEAEIR